MSQILFGFARPWTTPGTSVQWRNLAEWLGGWKAINTRKLSSARYRAEYAHLELLSRCRGVIESEPSPWRLMALKALLLDVRPVRGRRADHPTTPLLCWVNNRILNS